VRLTALCLLTGLAAVPAGATEVISFEEIAAQNTNRATLGEEYAHLGVHFTATDDGSTWDGMTNGDPGEWGLEGSNGPTFAGFNGRSYRLMMRFDTPVPAFRVDVAAASGATPDGTFALEGYRNGVMVERTSVVLGGVNAWMTVGLTAEVDQVVWVGDTRGVRPFGADNVRWGLDAPTRLDVMVDVRPGSDENPVNPGSPGVLPVALLGSESFDVSIIDAETLALGVGAAPAHLPSLAYEDVNDDGWLDLVAHFRMIETCTAYGDTSMCLTGATLDGVELAGCDAIRTVPMLPPAAARKGNR
jgi:hypothetical protein